MTFLLFEHEDGRHAVAPAGAAFLAGDPMWHRVGPVEVHSVAPPTEPLPLGATAWAVVPDYRGYAHLGTGQYVINHSGEAPAELIISVATEAEKAGRRIGEERANEDHKTPIQPEAMCVRIRFENEAGLDALEAQLRHLREHHFAAAALASQPVTGAQAAEPTWKEQPNTIGNYWLVQDDGKIIGSAGSVPMGGGAPYYATLPIGTSLGEFVDIACAKAAVLAAFAGVQPEPRVETQWWNVRLPDPAPTGLDWSDAAVSAPAEPGLLQDEAGREPKKLSKWFADKPGARYQVQAGQAPGSMGTICTADVMRSMVAAAPFDPQSYVQAVPDHCDRITWRGNYYGLPLASARSALLRDFESWVADNAIPMSDRLAKLLDRLEKDGS